jgi:hypothetical protein
MDTVICNPDTGGAILSMVMLTFLMMSALLSLVHLDEKMRLLELSSFFLPSANLSHFAHYTVLIYVFPPPASQHSISLCLKLLLKDLATCLLY